MHHPQDFSLSKCLIVCSTHLRTEGLRLFLRTTEGALLSNWTWTVDRNQPTSGWPVIQRRFQH
jgi:hypothetical protein